MNHIHQQNEIRYLSLNRLDSEMSRLVMAYSIYDNNDNFVDNGYADTTGDWQEDFNVSENLGVSSEYRIYKYDNNKNGLTNDSYGLKLDSGNDKNWVQLKNISGEVNIVDNNDFVALLGWKVDSTTDNVNLSLSITYPYIYNNNSIVKLWDYVETLNLKTSIGKP